MSFDINPPTTKPLTHVSWNQYDIHDSSFQINIYDSTDRDPALIQLISNLGKFDK